MYFFGAHLIRIFQVHASDILSYNIGNYLIKHQSERYIIITNTSLLQHKKETVKFLSYLAVKFCL